MRVRGRRWTRCGPLVAVVVPAACSAGSTPSDGAATSTGGPSPTTTVAAGDLDQVETLAGMTLAEALAAPAEDDRPALLQVLGPPDAFVLRFEELDGVAVRRESWEYLDLGTRVDLLDGEVLWTAEMEPVPDGTILALAYDPADFRAGMTADEVVAAAGMPLQQVDVSASLAGATALVGEQLLAGFDQGRLVYVETFGLSPEVGS